jgi:hypothetical protein
MRSLVEGEELNRSRRNARLNSEYHLSTADCQNLRLFLKDVRLLDRMGERIDSRYLRKILKISKTSIVRVEAGERLNAALSLGRVSASHGIETSSSPKLRRICIQRKNGRLRPRAP